MMMFALTLLGLLLARLFAAHELDVQAAIFNGFDVDPRQIPIMASQPLILPISSSWRFVYFTNANSRIFPPVHYSSSGPARIQLVDIFCSGDEFLVQRVNMTDGARGEIFPSTLTLGAPSCSQFTFDPNGVLADGTIWSYFDHTFEGAGNWSLDVAAYKSPHSAGAALVRRIL